MKRKNFLATTALLFPVAVFANFKNFIRPNKPFKVNGSEDRFNDGFSYRGNQFFLKVSGKDTEGDLCIYDSVRVQKGGPRMHVHHSQDEWFFVTKGEFIFQVGEERYTLKEGDSLFGPRGIPHAFAQTSEGEGKLLLTYQPAGSMELFFSEARKLVNPTEEESRQLSQKHGMEIVGGVLDVK